MDSTKLHYASDFLLRFALNRQGGAPEWVELLPAGPQIAGLDGRRWHLEDPEAFVDAFNRAERSIPLDWEHGTEVLGSKGHRAPAAGWVERLEARNRSVWGKVSWTDAGRADVEGKAYRYLSPVFGHNREGRILKLKNAGLTNDPNLEMTALNRAGRQELPAGQALPSGQDLPSLSSQLGRNNMDLKPITDVLGLNDGASVEQIASAVRRLDTDVQTARNRAENPDLSNYVPKADYELAMNRLSDFQAKEQAALDAEIAQTVDAVIGVGDPAYSPAHREDFIAMCRAEGGLERFKRIAKPQLDKALNRVQSPEAAKTEESAALSPEEIALCRQTGVSLEDYRAEKANHEGMAQ